MSEFSNIEKKWQDYWEKNKTFKVSEDESKKPYYIFAFVLQPFIRKKLHSIIASLI